MKRKKMSRKASNKNFAKGTKVSKRNIAPKHIARGGYRL